MDEIIVYLDDYKSLGSGKYEIMYLDFRTSDDYENFIKITQTKEKPHGSYIKIKNYHSPNRLRKGAYYTLNVDLLKQMPTEPVANSLLFMASFNMANSNGNNLLLQPHKKLDPKELKASQHNKIDKLEAIAGLEGLKISVNNVGQANWNEVRNESSVIFVFDIGAPINAKIAEVEKYIKEYAKNYRDYQPVLILSHWDVDHYHCLLNMSDAEIVQCFSKFICVDKMKSMTSKQLYDRIEKLLGGNNVCCINPDARTKGIPYPRMKEKYCADGVGVYAGEDSNNTNYSGIILFVQGIDNCAIFSGDSFPIQVSQVLAYQTSRYDASGKGHYLVVPHHGGEFRNKKCRKYHCLNDVNALEAIISVGQNNIYGHPSTNTTNYLQSIAKWSIVRTDLNGTITRNLSHYII